MALASTARSVDLYRDTSLDGLIGQEKAILRGSSHRRNGGSTRHSVSDASNVSSNLPEAPEVPRAPPISYKTSGQENGAPQRSFSQRAKGRQFYRDTLADDDETLDNRPMENSRRQPAETYKRGPDDASRGGGQRGIERPSQINTALPGRKAVRNTQMPVMSPMEAPVAMRSPRAQEQRSRRLSENQQHSEQPISAPTRSAATRDVPNRGVNSQHTEESFSAAPQSGAVRQIPDSAVNSQYPEEPISAVSRSAAMRDVPNSAVDSQRREWAPDRSPLQKLEVTLNDISKEEKRARVEEAEMLLRESKGGRGGRLKSRDITPVAQAPVQQSSSRAKAVSSEANGLKEAGLVRNLSGTQRDRLQHSTTVDSRKPDVRRLSGDGRRGFEYGEQQFDSAGPVGSKKSSRIASNQLTSEAYAEESQPEPVARRMHSVRHQAAAESLPAAAERYDQTHADRQMIGGSSRRPGNSQGMDSYPSQSRVPDTSSRFPQHNPVWQANSQTPAHTVPSNITRAVSMQQGKPPARFADDREIVRSNSIRKDANSSHRAAFADAGMSGAAASESVITRDGSRKLQKAPPSGYERAKERPDDRKASFDDASNRMSAQQPSGVLQKPPPAPYEGAQALRPDTLPRVAQINSQKDQIPVGLGLRESPNVASVNDKYVSDSQPQRPRQQSVSFKEPLDRVRPVDEWRKGGVARLSAADFALDTPADGTKDQTWWEAGDSPASRRKSSRRSTNRGAASSGGVAIDDRHAEFRPPLYLKCGPLLRYTGMKRIQAEGSEELPNLDREICRYSVMIVTQDSHSSYETVPTLRLFSRPKKLLPPPPQLLEDEELAPEYVDPLAGSIKLSRTGRALYVRPVDHLDEEKDLSRIENDEGLFEESPSPLDINGSREATTATTNKRTSDMDGEHVGKYQELKGVRLYADPSRDVTFWRFNIEVELGEAQQHLAYRINRGAAVGFWVPARSQSMNIMFYSCNGFSLSASPDKFSGPDPLWRDVLNTAESSPFHVMIGGGDQVYMDRVMVDTQYFGEWTRIKNPQHKHHALFSSEMREELESFYLERYCMWFSQGLFGMANSQIPMVNMWDDHDIIDGFGSYPNHFMRNEVFSGLGGVAFKYYMLFQQQSMPEETVADEPSWVLGRKPGPYIEQVSRSIFLHLGKHLAFLGLDCRTERTKSEILSLETCDTVLERCRKDIIEGETKHLILLLGVPIAYPRLVFLENVLTSRAMDPIKALGRVGFIKGGLLNKFDGGVEILDDLDDHWTAKNHKDERNGFIEDLQDLAAEKSVRITILGGDVHLGAIGQFYSNPKLRIPKDRDHRYMPNVISSAIVNTPPSDRVADFLNKRNRIHHLNKYTDESMIPMFLHDVDGKNRNNKHLLPRRNWCSIKEYKPGLTPPPTPPESPSKSGSEADDEPPEHPQRRFSFTREDVNPRNIFRRISTRGAPPSSYRNTTGHDAPNEQQDVDPECPVHGGNGHYSQSALPNQRRHSFDSAGPGQRAASFEHESSGAPVRPGMFHRRPTNLSWKAARKGNVPGVDKEGNEVEVNEHVNLEGGLDIVINCEVNQKDPTGITVPYRLLVPALWYDGSSDREKLDDAAEVQRKPTLLKRLSSGGGRKNEGASVQKGTEGNWKNENGDETVSYSGSEDDEQQGRVSGPKRLFGLFGSRKGGKEPRYDGDDDYSQEQEQHGEERLHESQNRPPAYRQPAQNPPQHYYVSDENMQTAPGRQASIGGRQPYVISSQPQPQIQPQPHSQPRLQQHQLSKQERVLGIQALGGIQPPPKAISIGSDPDRFQQPEQRQLRGDGIIGRDSSLTEGNERSPTTEQGFSPGQNQGQGYGGVEAYRPPKPERRWSLRGFRDKARSGTRWDWE